MTKKRRRPIHLHVMVSEEELALIQERMAEAGIRNMGAYMRKMALNGYVLHVDLSPVRELVSLQRRCSNNLNQVAIQANTYGGIYPEEIKALQRDYETLWGPLSDLLKSCRRWWVCKSECRLCRSALLYLFFTNNSDGEKNEVHVYQFLGKWRTLFSRFLPEKN